MTREIIQLQQLNAESDTQYPIYLLSHFMSDVSLRAQALEQSNLGSQPHALTVRFDSGTFTSGFVPWALKAV